MPKIDPDKDRSKYGAINNAIANPELRIKGEYASLIPALSNSDHEILQ